MNPILARKLMLVTKFGSKREYTHVTLIEAEKNTLRVIGEASEGGVRTNVGDTFKIDDLLFGIIEFYKLSE